MAIFGLILIAIFWIGTAQRSYTELSEAISSEFSKNANLALALDVQTNQLLTGIDHFLLLIKDQYEGAPPRMPLRRIVAPAFATLPSITFIGVTNERGDVVESLQEFAPTNIIDREFFKTHRQSDTHKLLISEPVLGRVSGRWAITLTRRLNKPDGSFAGIAAISIEPRYLTRLFETTSLGPLDVMSLVLTNGISLARRRGEAISFGEDISQSQLLMEQRAAADRQLHRARRHRRPDAHLQLSDDARLSGDRHGRHARKRRARGGARAAAHYRAWRAAADPPGRRRLHRRHPAARAQRARQPDAARAGVAARQGAGRDSRHRSAAPADLLEQERRAVVRLDRRARRWARWSPTCSIPDGDAARSAPGVR